MHIWQYVVRGLSHICVRLSFYRSNRQGKECARFNETVETGKKNRGLARHISAKLHLDVAPFQDDSTDDAIVDKN